MGVACVVACLVASIMIPDMIGEQGFAGQRDAAHHLPPKTVRCGDPDPPSLDPRWQERSYLSFNGNTVDSSAICLLGGAVRAKVVSFNSPFPSTDIVHVWA
jgi:hypothetical protein